MIVVVVVGARLTERVDEGACTRSSSLDTLFAATNGRQSEHWTCGAGGAIFCCCCLRKLVASDRSAADRPVLLQKGTRTETARISRWHWWCTDRSAASGGRTGLNGLEADVFPST